MNKAARCRELMEKMENSHMSERGNHADILNLKKKIFGKGNDFTAQISSLTLTKLAESLDFQVNKCIHLQSLDRINVWKDKMRHDFQARASWMNKKFNCNSHAVGTPESSSADWEQGAEQLRSYWQNLGERGKMTLQDRNEVVN